MQGLALVCPGLQPCTYATICSNVKLKLKVYLCSRKTHMYSRVIHL